MNDDAPPAIGGRIARIGLIILAGLGAVFFVGIIVGLVGTTIERGDGIGFGLIGFVATAIGLGAGCVYGGWRAYRGMIRDEGRPTTRERRNQLVLAGCALLGGVIGMALTLGGGTPFAAFSNGPISPLLAIAIVAAIAIVLPAVSLYWFRHVVDEQEAAAYKLGALWGLSAYFIGAPAWWLLWRGGLVPAPDGIVIYFVTTAITGVIWIWAKYR